MPDNIAITQGSGTTIATDDVSGVQYQVIKISGGADGLAGSLVDWTTGTAGSPAGGVTSVQGVSGGTALPVSNPALSTTQALALGSTTGPMVQASVLTAAPTYTSGTINPLSMTVAGGLRVTPSGLTASGSNDTTSRPVLVGGKQNGLDTVYFLAVDASGSIRASLSSTGSQVLASTTPLGISASVNGASYNTNVAFQTINNVTFNVSSFADQAGTLRIQVSTDDITWRNAFSVSTTANTYAELKATIIWPYYRVRYENGVVAQTVFALNYSLTATA